MTIRIEEFAENAKKLFLEGRLDMDTSQELREQIQLIGDDVSRLVFDLRDLTYITSAGLRELLICRKRFRGEDDMVLENVSPDVFDIFKTTGFDTILPVKNVEADATTYVSMSFKEFCARKAAAMGGRVVIRTQDRTWTWRDIDMGSQIIAKDLAGIGVGRRTHVAICGYNSINWVMTFFAVQKLGAIAMLLNPAMRASEIAAAADITDITHLCCGEIAEVKEEEELMRQLAQSGCPIKQFYSIRENRRISDRFGEYEEVQDKFQADVGADDPCTVIFTSGSTGRPKGVLLSSYNILNAASGSYKDQTLTPEDRTCLILPMFHVFGLVGGLFANMMADSTIYLPPDIRTGTILELISREQCTVFHSVPTMLIALMNNKDFRPEKLSSLRCSIISGSAATAAQIEAFRKAMPNNHFLASYGLSEMAPVSITNYNDSAEHVLYTVGRPVKNIRIRILNRVTGGDCATRQEGEILVQGFNLMVGYYKVPMENQSIDENGWLHTGDLGYLDEDGYLCLSGRLKELIIRGGENIMPGEVEAAVSRLPYINNVKVLGIPSEFFGEEVAACVILKEGASLNEEDARTELSANLARYKVPSAFFVFDSFPMLSTGKVDGVTLKNMVLSRIADKS